MTDDPRPPVDGPTSMNPTSGQLAGGTPEEPTVPDEGLSGYGPSTYGPVTAEPTAPDHGPGSAGIGSDEQAPEHEESPTSTWLERPPPSEPAPLDEPTIAEPAVWPSYPGPFSVDGPTVAEPIAVDDDGVTRANEDPTTTGPTVGAWPFDQFEPPPPSELVWQPDSAPVAPPRRSGRGPGYYITLGAAVVLVVGLVAVAAVVTVLRPTQNVAGSASAAIPVVTSSNQPPPATTSTTSQAQPPPSPYAELAAHPLSTASTRMPDATCALPRFDLADDKQAAFFQAAKVCADDAWRPVLQAAKLDDAQVQVVTVTGPVQTQSCGDLAPTSPPTMCDGTVYMAPAYLRDTEQLGRYPGKYFGVFLREYARAIQFGTGLDQLAAAVPNGSAADIDPRLDLQATCLAGMTSGAMAGRGAVDDNITGEIRQRLTTVDAPPDAQALLDKGFQQRVPAACNTWG
jgi:hypothetical protein